MHKIGKGLTCGDVFTKNATVASVVVVVVVVVVVNSPIPHQLVQVDLINGFVMFCLYAAHATFWKRR